ncbi:zinc-ribbon domain-containing protein [Clostridium fallax]|uniref:Zinc-ribbon family protein n=1 Tax=Clostridium fallax TaxID=1533 RepID=A0A1M4SHZ3_9CLOT|nr:zinc-ribbon domain-containing protein [Clostridium fallax]SHE31810.1 zinc-ribbon family protein [Clostridium fallax]SQB07839.1 zinc-ribbon domain-containing protein [Clostridium fallax]
MFFIGIFGIDKKEVKLGTITSTNCNICSNYSVQIIKTYSFFHFFFIPLFKWNEEYFGICANCNAIYKIKPEKGKAFEKGDKLAITYWDLTLINNSFNSIKKCPNCNRECESDYEFCPYCGHKLH